MMCIMNLIYRCFIVFVNFFDIRIIFGKIEKTL